MRWQGIGTEQIVYIMDLSEAIENYLKRGFGSMNKNDFEVFIFNEIIKSPKHKGKSNYDLSCTLRIPETKVKRLRYEANLKYPLDENAIKATFKEYLEFAKMLPDNTRPIEICIEDDTVRKYIISLLKKGHRFSDSSFNSEIMRMTVDDFSYILDNVCNDEEKERLLEKIKDNKLKKQFTNAIISLLGDVKQTIVDLTIQGLINIIN